MRPALALAIVVLMALACVLPAPEPDLGPEAGARPFISPVAVLGRPVRSWQGRTR